MKEILLIGNGPSVLNYQFGAIIDKLPCVVRYNAFAIDGYEDYVGTKCNIWCTCCERSKWYDKYNYDEVFFMGTSNLKCLAFNRMREKLPQTKLIPWQIYLDVREKVGHQFVSSGVVSMFYFSLFYDSVYLLGFDSFAASTHHYWTNRPVHDRHSGEKEKAFIDSMIEKGIVRQFNNYTYLHDHDERYGTGGAFASKILEFEPDSVLDYGCGKGGLVKYLLSKGVRAVGYDPNVFEYQQRPTKQDMLISTDVLEHIPENELSIVLADMLSYKPRLMFHVISNRKASRILPDGTNAHKTVKDTLWWFDKLKESFLNYDVRLLEHNEKNNFSVYFLKR